MLTLTQEVESILEGFASLFAQRRSWQHAQVLLIGLWLCQGKRTVSRLLQVMGLGEEPHYHKYYRILSRVGWSGLSGAKQLLKLLRLRLIQDGPLVIGLDDTLERRWGRSIWGLGIYRDPVRSTSHYNVKCSGLKWVVMQVLVPLPWSPRPWGLPFFRVLAPSKSTNVQDKRRHKTTVDWAVQMMKQVNRWVQQSWICVADGGYGNLKFGWQCRYQGVSLISRLRLDANLYDFAPAYDPHRPGKPRTKGARLLTPQQRLAQIHTPAPPGVLHLLPQLDPMALPHPQRAQLHWYGGGTQVRLLYTGTALWATDDYRPLPIRWVLVIDPSGKDRPAALFSTNLTLEPAFIVETFVARWSLEVTFQESRAHLGFQTQRHGSKLAVQRTTPVILAFFRSPA